MAFCIIINLDFLAISYTNVYLFFLALYLYLDNWDHIFYFIILCNYKLYYLAIILLIYHVHSCFTVFIMDVAYNIRTLWILVDPYIIDFLSLIFNILLY